MKRYNVAVVGVGAVGQEMLRVLRQRRFPVGHLVVLARKGRTIKVDGLTYRTQAIAPRLFNGIDLALFAGTEGEKGAALTYAKEAIRRGAVVIDNGADFRMDPKVPLVVPEVNPGDLKKHQGLIANPNCSTIQFVVALAPLHRAATVTRAIVSTYQAASGAGRSAVEELKAQTTEALVGRPISKPPAALPRQIAFNVIPQIGPFGALGYSSEEWKLVKETHKILHDDSIKITATCVRVPVATGHSESVYLETQQPLSPNRAKQLLRNAPGVALIEAESDYPIPIHVAGRDAVYVGRVRSDPFVKRALSLWIVADNLRKGAALNAIQIAEYVIHR